MNRSIAAALILASAVAFGAPLHAREKAAGEALFAKALSKKRQVVEFSSQLAPEEIERRMLDMPCGREEVRTTGIAPVGTLFVPVSTSVQFSVEYGMNTVDRSRWLLLRGDGSAVSAAVSGVQLVPRVDGGSDVRVIKANKKRLEQIRTSVEAGRLFCDWRDFDYSWD